ncbi:hypothetical protein PFISCL1PPCAC_14956 [Pristionchus fissidentatus]|uniref:Glycosyltransferase family 92 protein n=1 Tax=Pristionchus fissidentatus TaxID=1538716 RepID=A0AAV5VVT0_9BILA|nr:hypothetical protein PFISCL1PPCAC_14956 [Pristionchus fissidentatus]
MQFLLWKIFYFAFFLILFGFIYERSRYRNLAPPIVAVFMLGAVGICMRPELHQVFQGRNPTSLMGIYVGEAFRTSDNEVRFYFFQDQENLNEILYMDGDQWTPVTYRCICPLATILSQCTVEGHIGVATFTRAKDARQLRLRTKHTGTQYEISVKDGRILPDHVYPHQFGVCLQPVYFSADWPAFAQYIEFWLASGATKFYLYIHSVTPKVRQILHQYERILGDSLEIIDWSDLPVENRHKGDFYADPNTRIFSAGGHNALNDCILRARSHVKFLGVIDLDELIHVPSGRSPIDVFETLAKGYPDAANFAFDWQYVQDETNTRKTTKPSDLHFGALRYLRKPFSKNIIEDYVRLKKVIHRPERVIMADVHNTIINDMKKPHTVSNDIRFDTSVSISPKNVPSINQRFNQVLVHDSIASVLHLRRFNALSKVNVPYNTSVSYDDIREKSKVMDENWRLRIKNGTIKDRRIGNWYPTFEQTVRDLESCRTFPFNVNNRIGKGYCRALINCEPMLTVREAYVKADQMWSNVAHRGKFIEYIKT